MWIDTRLAVCPSPIEGQGLFTTDAVAAGRVLIHLGGRLVTSDQLGALIRTANANPDLPYVDTITVYEGAHLVLPRRTTVRFANHSCDPTLWHVGPFALAARRDLRAGEEITVDYGTQSGADGLVMDCRCGTGLCRGQITSDDWRLPDLRRRYHGHWVPALQRRIDSA